MRISGWLVSWQLVNNTKGLGGTFSWSQGPLTMKGTGPATLSLVRVRVERTLLVSTLLVTHTMHIYRSTCMYTFTACPCVHVQHTYVQRAIVHMQLRLHDALGQPSTGGLTRPHHPAPPRHHHSGRALWISLDRLIRLVGLGRLVHVRPVQLSLVLLLPLHPPVL